MRRMWVYAFAQGRNEVYRDDPAYMVPAQLAMPVARYSSSLVLFLSDHGTWFPALWLTPWYGVFLVSPPSEHPAVGVSGWEMPDAHGATVVRHGVNGGFVIPISRLDTSID